MTERSQNLKLSRTWNGNTNFNNLGNFGNFNDLFTNQNIGTWYALLGALLLGEKEFFGHSLGLRLPSEMEVAPRYILLTLFTLFKLLYTALTVACMHKNVVTVG